jgi:membrane fusion protein (multidrug efflux system)
VGLDNPDLLLRPGMLVTAKIGIERREQAAIVSSEAVAMEKANAFVFVVEGDKATKRPVKLGFSDGRNVEVLEGVKPGDTLALVGQRTLTNGQSVRVVSQ